MADRVNIGAMTPLQAAWLPVRTALDDACRDLDAATFAVFVSMLGISVARLHVEALDHEWEQAA